MTPPPPAAAGTFDRSVRWAFSAAMHRPNRAPRVGRVINIYGVTVIRSARSKPFGKSTHSSGYLTHLADAVYTAWRGGRMVGSMVRWRCGGSTIGFRLGDEAMGLLCPPCLAAIGRVHLVVGVISA